MRPYNFSPGPAVLPDAVLMQAAQEMLDWGNSGMSVMEMSHRSPYFESIFAQAEADFRELLSIPEDYAVLFMQGGAIAENAIVPLNLIARSGAADYVVTGHWSLRSYKEAQKYGDIHLAASSESSRGESALSNTEQKTFTSIPDVCNWKVRANAAYLHLCGNETVDGVEFLEWPDLKLTGSPDIPIVIDASSHILSRQLDVSKFGLIYGGAQKNIGPAGVTFVIVRRDLLGFALKVCPSAFDYSLVARNNSMYNTPPTYAIYITGLVLKWLKQQALPGQTALESIETINQQKAQLLYGCLDASEFYQTRVHPSCRSRMNIPFYLRDETLNDAFLQGALTAGLLNLKGHKLVGGMRASIYNAMPLSGVQALVDYLQDFERQYG